MLSLKPLEAAKFFASVAFDLSFFKTGFIEECFFTGEVAVNFFTGPVNENLAYQLLQCHSCHLVIVND